MDKNEIESILELHRKWLYEGDGGKRADLRGADLQGADLRGADLRGAYLQGADLQGADLRGADLRGADLRGAYLRGADLRGAYLRGADLRGADLRGAENSELALAMTEIVPREGAFIGYKKCRKDEGAITHECLVKLRIPEDAKRSNATGRKCRCSKAEAIEITDIGTGKHLRKAISLRSDFIEYETGKTVEVENFDTDRLHECAPGIHFFLTPEEAMAYEG